MAPLRPPFLYSIAPATLSCASCYPKCVKQNSILTTLFSKIRTALCKTQKKHFLSLRACSLQIFESFLQTHRRIIECFGLEGTFRCHPAQPPCSEQGHLQLDQVAQSPVQPGLGCFQGWGLHCLSGQPVPVFQHPHCKKFLPYIQSKSTLFYPCPITTGLAKKLFPIFFISPL